LGRFWVNLPGFGGDAMVVPVKEILDETIKNLSTRDNIETLATVSEILFHLLNTDRKVILVGNGGSSATMSHFTGDLINQGIGAICLTDNIPALTAKTNDQGWADVYSELLKIIYRDGDIVIVATVHGSSGESPDGEEWSSNLMKVGRFVCDAHGTFISLSGNDGGEIKTVSDTCVSIPSTNPYVVEGIHSVWCHAIINQIEQLKRRKEKE